MKLASYFYAVLFLLVAALPAAAQTYIWDPSGSTTGPTDGSGTWNTANSNWYNGGLTTWGNSSADTAQFGSATTTGAVGYNISVSGTVNVGTITEAQNAASSYNIQNGTIASSGLLTFNMVTSAAYFADYFNNVNFQASNYLFTAPGGAGTKIINSTINGGNAATFTLGTGTDTGLLQVAGGGFSSSNIALTVKNGWTFFVSGQALSSANLTGFGSATQLSTNAYAGALALGSNLNVPITLAGDTLIENGGVSTTKLSGSIGGTGNLYLASDFTANTSSTVNSTLIVATSPGTYSGATIITNNTQNGATAVNPTGGVGFQTIALGANNALSTTGELVLGTTKGSAAVTGATAALYTSNGTFDMAGFNQTVSGLATSSPTAAQNFIGNNSGAGVSTLTVAGNSTPAGGFGGIIEDNFAAQETVKGVAGGKVAVALTSGSLTLTGANTYTGGTIVSGGTLTAGVASTATTGAFGGPTGAMTVNGSGKLNLNNFNITVGALTLGNADGSAGTAGIGFGTATNLTLTASGLTWNGGNATLSFNLATANNGGDLLNLGSGALTAGTGTGFDISLAGGLAGQTYDLINFGSTTFSANQFTETSGLAGTFQIQGDELVFVASAIPEPNTGALLLMGALLAGAFPYLRKRLAA